MTDSSSEIDYHGSPLLVSLEVAKQHLRVEPDVMLEDDLISLYIEIASDHVQEYLQRAVYATQADYDAAQSAGQQGFDDNAIVVNASIKGAVLLLIGHYYRNREDVTVGQAPAELPNASKALLAPYRMRLGV